MADKDLRKLLQNEDKDTVVQRTVANQVNKELENMKPTDRLAVAGPAVDAEINLARETGQLSESEANEVKAATENESKFKVETRKGGVKGEFLNALTYFAPQAIGAALGGIMEGSAGAVAGAEQAGKLTQGYRDSKRQQEQDAFKMQQSDVTSQLKLRDQALRDRSLDLKADAQQNVKRADQIIHKDTGETLFTNNQGQVLDQSGKVVPPEFQRTLQAERVDLAEKRAGQGDKRINISLGNLGERIRSGDRQDEKFEEAKRQKDELSDVQVREITELDEGLETVNRIKELSASVDTGPIAGRLQAAKEPFGGSSEEFTKLKSATGKQLAEFIKSISGSAVSEQEAQRLKKLIPTVNDTEKVFKAKLEEFERGLKRGKENKLKAAQKLQGKNTGNSVDRSKLLDRLRKIRAAKGQ